jgi:hypothetical protein
MKKRLPTCRGEYNRGLAERRKYPLCSGRYKLDESLRYPEGALQHLKGIRECRSQRDLRDYCSFNDSRSVLLDTPQDLAFRLGYDTLPAIEALDRDGVPASVLATSIPVLEARAAELVNDLQRVAEQYQFCGIKNEFQAIRDGRPTDLQQACYGIVDLINDGLALVPEDEADIFSEYRTTKLRDLRG